jgi:hypothetical protein
MLVVVEDERPGVVGVEDTCALVVAAMVNAVVAPIAVADVDVVVLVAAAVVDAFAFVVAVVGGLAAVQLATGRLEHVHGERVVAQSCGFR